jgi:hypothetical protein
MRAAGQSFGTIARALGFKDRSGAFRAVKRALDDAGAERSALADNLLDEQLQRIEILYRANVTAALAGDIAALNACVRLIQERAKLLGLYAPTKVEGEVRHDHYDNFDREVEELATEIRRRAQGSGLGDSESSEATDTPG